MSAPAPTPPPAPPPAAPPAPVPPEPPIQPTPPEPSPPTPPVPASANAPDPEPPGTPLEPGTPSAEMSWAGAGAFVWHETDVAPEAPVCSSVQTDLRGWRCSSTTAPPGPNRGRLGAGPPRSEWLIGRGLGSLAYRTRAGGRTGAPVARSLRAGLLHRECGGGVQVQQRRWSEQ